MNPIRNYPSGTVIGKTILERSDYKVCLLRIKAGSRTQFVESLFRGKTSVAFSPAGETLRSSDEFYTEKSADNYYQKWLSNKLKVEEYKILSQEGK